MLSRTLRPSVTVTAAALTLAGTWLVPAIGQQPTASPAPGGSRSFTVPTLEAYEVLTID